MDEKTCSHLNAITGVKHPTRRECEECVKSQAGFICGPVKRAVSVFALLLGQLSNRNLRQTQVSIHKIAPKFDVLFRTHPMGRSPMFRFSGWRKSLGSSWGVLRDSRDRRDGRDKQSTLDKGYDKKICCVHCS